MKGTWLEPSHTIEWSWLIPGCWFIVVLCIAVATTIDYPESVVWRSSLLVWTLHHSLGVVAAGSAQPNNALDEGAECGFVEQLLEFVRTRLWNDLTVVCICECLM